MKKLFLLLVAGSIGLSLNAQENKHSVVFTGAGKPQNVKGTAPVPERFQSVNKTKQVASKTANKTTAAGMRWYNYAEFLDLYLTSVSGTTAFTFPIMWNDTMGKVNYTSGLANNTMVSMGSLLDPACANFNDPTFFNHQMKLTSTDQYAVDSIELTGIYIFNPAKASVVDTLIITLTNGSVVTTGDDIIYSNFGDAATVGDYGLTMPDSVEFGLVKYDSVTNHATGTTAYTFKITLNSAAWGDTLSNGLFDTLLKLPVPYPVTTAGNMLGYSLTFKSGDAAFVPNDTISGERYNIFRPAYAVKGTAAAPQFSPYWHTDFNSGQFKSLPNYENGWDGVYVPMYAWTSGGGASSLQHNASAFHILCSTCGIVDGVENVTNNITATQAYPNPASGELNVNFNVAAATNVTVTLTNTLGQVVATQTVSNATNGTATFNTAKIATGVYFYTVIANGDRSTGRVVVAH